jgi:hypothetical protein
MKKIIVWSLATAFVCYLNVTSVAAQGSNGGQGGDDKNIQPTAHWNLFVKGAVEKASLRKVEALRNYRTSYTYQAAVQWFPDLTQDAR